MGERELILNIQDDQDYHLRFRELITDIQRLPQSRKHKGPLNPNQILNIGFTENGQVFENGDIEERKIVRVKMRLDNYYTSGYQRLENGEYVYGRLVYEFKDDAEEVNVHTLPGSTILNFKVSYPKVFKEWQMGYQSFVGAVRGLGRNQNVVHNLLTIALTISESVRFRWIALHQITLFRVRRSWILPRWMDQMVHNWGFVSDLAREYADRNGIQERDLPIEPSPEDEVLVARYKWSLFSKMRTLRAAAVCATKLTPLP